MSVDEAVIVHVPLSGLNFLAKDLLSKPPPLFFRPILTGK
jgi:hypothetical protein